MKEYEIQEHLYRYLRMNNRRIVVPNSTIYGWEADMISLTRAMLADEYEIKTNLRDYKRDLHKKKFKRNNWNKQPRKRVHNMPNRFWYVYNGFDIKKFKPFAGYIMVHDSGKCEVLKKAPLIHSVKVNNTHVKKFLVSMSFKYWNIR